MAVIFKNGLNVFLTSVFVQGGKSVKKITQGGNLTLAANQKFSILSAKLTWNDSLAAGGQVLVHKSWFRHFGTSVGPNHP